MIMKLVTLAVLFATAASSAISAGKSFSMVLVGGGLDENNDDVWNKIIELGGGKGVARFGVIASASEDPCCDVQSSWVYYNQLLRKYGAADTYYIPVTVDTKGNNSDPEVVAQIKTMTGFFFGGGDQQRIVYSFYNSGERIPSDALNAIRETLLTTGGVVAGTSAGTDIQTINTMISGGVSYDGLVNGTTTFWRTAELPNENSLTAYGPGGIGLFPYGMLDTHFANRGRQGRMIQLMVDSRSLPTGSPFAYCVDENTALVVTGDWTNRVGQVIGERGVLLIDMSRATIDTSSTSAFKPLANIRASRLSSGDVINLQSQAVTPASYKTLLAGRESSSAAITTANVFEEYTFQFDAITQSLFTTQSASTYGLSLETSPYQIKVTISKTADNEEGVAWGYDGVDPATNVYGYGYVGMWMSIASL